MPRKAGHPVTRPLRVRRAPHGDEGRGGRATRPRVRARGGRVGAEAARHRRAGHGGGAGRGEVRGGRQRGRGRPWAGRGGGWRGGGASGRGGRRDGGGPSGQDAEGEQSARDSRGQDWGSDCKTVPKRQTDSLVPREAGQGAFACPEYRMASRASAVADTHTPPRSSSRGCRTTTSSPSCRCATPSSASSPRTTGGSTSAATAHEGERCARPRSVSSTSATRR